jgi:uncharacterized protein (DUF433 family)
MSDWSTCPAVERHANVVSGAWVFRGTRVPIRALCENLRDGATIDQFLEWFPGVTRQQVQAMLDHEARELFLAGRP